MSFVTMVRDTAGDLVLLLCCDTPGRAVLAGGPRGQQHTRRAAPECVAYEARWGSIGLRDAGNE